MRNNYKPAMSRHEQTSSKKAIGDRLQHVSLRKQGLTYV